MSSYERKKSILEQLHIYGKVEITELSEALSVSPMTIRRDLDLLEKQKKLIRTHGGAVLPQALINEQSFASKAGSAVEEKKQIALEAVSLVKPNMTVLLDSGTTTLEIARLLKNNVPATVITNDIQIAAELMDSHLEVIIIGGRLQNDVGALFGSLAENTLRNMHVDLFFMGAHAIHSAFGITAPTLEKAAVKQEMIKTAEKVVLVADSSKFHQKAFSKVCDLDFVTTVITDRYISEEIRKSYEEYVDIVIAK
ncbi:DeoR/GlpR family DNA-binding transcription regulator [Bacillus sp. PK3_68]|uniref:DeoR/GlpR family DNA-binding transcription regulator n=1 Tax=Bacillus sp. PK3_68 TaxID=2027408 RepID=UPI000E72E881|nr:DeoR/GlpR family DNA-binding transcription regulator [Bacillus sp. PK3_68]RJS61937.1 transcriptional regulator [Bacillus sp. PK3_68]